ncbi:MAG TPA: hypothetical protein VFU11_09710 [Solirubrobacterales bacterium]|nr:hypothetical protein [Solirubrobacterales bacterium]
MILAIARSERLQSDGRPRFDLSEEELERSTQTAMRLADGALGDTISLMTTREKAHALLDELSDAELDEVVKLIEVRHEESAEPEMAELPEAWRRLPSGAPAPNWVAAVDEARRGH